MLRITLDLMYEKETLMDEEISTVCNIVESNLTQVQKEELFKVYVAALQKAEAAKPEPKPLTAEELAAKNPQLCEGCEE